MKVYRNWLLTSALFTSLLLNAVQAWRGAVLAHRVHRIEETLQDTEENRVKNLELIARNQRFELTRLRLQINAIGNPPLPVISPAEVERGELDSAAQTHPMGSAGPDSRHRELPRSAGRADSGSRGNGPIQPQP